MAEVVCVVFLWHTDVQIVHIIYKKEVVLLNSCKQQIEYRLCPGRYGMLWKSYMPSFCGTKMYRSYARSLSKGNSAS